jgi:hypothetical protein
MFWSLDSQTVLAEYFLPLELSHASTRKTRSFCLRLTFHNHAREFYVDVNAVQPWTGAPYLIFGYRRWRTGCVGYLFYPPGIHEIKINLFLT